MITQQRLIELVEYSPKWGLFTLRSTGKVVYTTDSAGFVRLYLDGKIYPAHRLAWLWVHGELPKKHIIHKDSDKTNNSIDNLVLSGSQEAVKKKRIMMKKEVEVTTPEDKRFSNRVKKFTSIGYEPVGRHLIRQEGEGRRSIIVEYERYIRSLIQ